MKLIKDFIQPKKKKKKKKHKFDKFRYPSDIHQSSKAYKIYNGLKKAKSTGAKLSVEQEMYIDKMQELDDKCSSNPDRYDHDYKILNSVYFMNKVLYQRSDGARLTDLWRHKNERKV
tara:strand:+ start:91 stop:441 length:351 start_codon:yes stop_codon:yes gene_type:complete